MDGLPTVWPGMRPVVDVVVRVFRLGVVATFKLALQSLDELEPALSVGNPVLLLLQLGIVVRKLVEENGDGHAVEDDAKGDAAKRHAAAQVGDRHDVTVADSGDAHLRDDKDPSRFILCVLTAVYGQ